VHPGTFTQCGAIPTRYGVTAVQGLDIPKVFREEYIVQEYGRERTRVSKTKLQAVRQKSEKRARERDARSYLAGSSN